jgi:glutamine synthetase
MREQIKITNIKDFLIMSYDELEERNLEIRQDRKKMKSPEFFKEKIVKYLTSEKRIKAVNICFTDLEGKLMSLDYDKNYILKSSHNLTFDGSSIRGFSTQDKSDLMLQIDWSSFRWLPADIFGPGKVMMFANVCSQNKEQYECDFRGMLQNFTNSHYEKNKYVFNVAPETEGFLLDGTDVEQMFSDTHPFSLVTNGGYYNSLPQDKLRIFIDIVAEAQRAMGFENEKDHPEVAPSQFELNYRYCDPVAACDQIQIYKLVCRQVAKTLGCTASFLPKPVVNINGSGMHTNISISQNNKNLFATKSGLSQLGKDFATAILYHAKDMCLVMNSSVNAYRRLDPKFEAPNEIKMSSSDRGSMVRIPLGDESSSRIEVRSVAPDCNPYLTIFALLEIGMMGGKNNNGKKFANILEKREKLPSNIYDAIRYFNNSEVMPKIMGKVVHEKFADLKTTIANRCPRDLGNLVKKEEVIYHHEITNQNLWYRF